PARDPGPAEHDVGLGLVRNDDRAAPHPGQRCRLHGARWTLTGGPRRERPIRGSERAAGIEGASEHENGAAGADRRAVVRAHLLDRRRTHDRLVADRTGAERMTGRIRELAPGLVGHAARVLL